MRFLLVKFDFVMLVDPALSIRELSWQLKFLRQFDTQFADSISFHTDFLRGPDEMAQP
jgi:hypothetical protein